MNPLQTELHRLYAATAKPIGADAAPLTSLIGPPDLVRALVMEMTRPPDWRALAHVWQGVQAELGLPAPGIAVSGTDALQLWFSLEQAMPAAEAHALLQRLRARFIPAVEPDRVRLLPAAGADTGLPELHARPVPAAQGLEGNWSAFVAPDLAPVFEESPWLDIPPSEEGQAALLRALKSISPQALETALKRLRPALQTAPAATVQPVELAAPRHACDPSGKPAHTDPREFLLQVMNDFNAPLALRIEAAKALLPHPPAA